MWPWQGWADSHPAQAMLLMGLLVALPVALFILELVGPGGPDYIFVALFAFIAGRGALTMWRQYERMKAW